jgi:hypothetical protein
MDKFITDTEKLFDEKVGSEWDMGFDYGYDIIKIKQFLKSKLQEAYQKGFIDGQALQVEKNVIIEMDNQLNKLKQQLIEKIEAEKRSWEEIDCDFSNGLTKAINIIKEN